MPDNSKKTENLDSVSKSIQLDENLHDVLDSTQQDLVASIGGDNTLNPLSESLPYWDEFQEIVLKYIKDSPIKDKVVAYLYRKFIDYKKGHGRKNVKFFHKIKEYMFDVNKKFSEIKHSELQEIIRNYILDDKDAKYIYDEVQVAVKLNDYNISNCISKFRSQDIDNIGECYNLLILLPQIEKLPLENVREILKSIFKAKDYKLIKNFLKSYHELNENLRRFKLNSNKQFLSNLDNMFIGSFEINKSFDGVFEDAKEILLKIWSIKNLFDGVDLNDI